MLRDKAELESPICLLMEGLAGGNSRCVVRLDDKGQLRIVYSLPSLRLHFWARMLHESTEKANLDIDPSFT